MILPQSKLYIERGRSNIMNQIEAIEKITKRVDELRKVKEHSDGTFQIIFNEPRFGLDPKTLIIKVKAEHPIGEKGRKWNGDKLKVINHWFIDETFNHRLDEVAQAVADWLDLHVGANAKWQKIHNEGIDRLESQRQENAKVVKSIDKNLEVDVDAGTHWVHGRVGHVDISATPRKITLHITPKDWEKIDFDLLRAIVSGIKP